MQGYDRQAAQKYILSHLVKADFKPIAADAPSLIERAMALDFDYMRQSGVLNEEGRAGDAYYDDDDAFEFIFGALSAQLGLSPDDRKAAALAALIDQYMDLQQDYLESAGLLGWD